MPEVMTKAQGEELLTLHKQMLETVDRYSKESGGQIEKLDTLTRSTVEKINARMDQIEVDVQKASRGHKHATEELKKNYDANKKAAFDSYVRKGKDGMGPDHHKLLTEGDATGGGFFVVPEYVDEIIKSIILISQIRGYAKVRTTNSNSVKLPKRLSTFAASWTAEAAQQGEALGLKYGMDDVPNHAMTAISRISMEDLEDNMFDMAAQINDEIAEQFALAEGTAFVNGNGKGQPEGFMFNSSVASDKTGQATALTYQGFVNAAHNLKTVYAKEATWFLNRQSIGAVRLLVDGQGRPIWQPFAQSGLAEGNAPTIVGVPYAEIPDMPNVGAGTYPVAIGAWKRAYVIVDRISISVKRDDVTQADQGVVRFLARKRVGGQLVLSEAVRKIQVSA